jgi:hypothetical protein
MGAIKDAKQEADAALVLSATNMAIEAGLAQKVERLTKLVHILWKEAEKLESYVKVIPEGLQIKADFSEILVLKNGGIRIAGQRVLVTAPGKSDLYF